MEKNKDKFILDVTCAGKMMWYNKNHPNTIYVDFRREEKGLIKQRPNFEVQPDMIMDFRALDFPDKSFKLVLFDPPHSLTFSDSSIMKKKFGALDKKTWAKDLKKGFDECWRVLDDYGTLIFKWSNSEISFKDVLACFKVSPLFGHVTAKSGKTKWFTFMKIPE